MTSLSTSVLAGIIVAAVLGCAVLGGLYFYLNRRRRVSGYRTRETRRPRISVEPSRVSKFVIDGDSLTTHSSHKSELTPLSMAPKFFPGVLDIRKHADDLSISSGDSTSDSSKNTAPLTSPSPTTPKDAIYSSATSTTGPTRLRSRSIMQTKSTSASSSSRSSSPSHPTPRPRSFTSDVASSRLTPNRRRPSLSTSTSSTPREESIVHPPVDSIVRPRRPLPEPPIRRPPIVSQQSRDSHIDSGVQLNAQDWNVSWRAVELPPVYTP